MPFFDNIGKFASPLLFGKGGLMGGGRGNQNPADSAMPYLNQIPGAANKYLGRYNSIGPSAENNARNTYGTMYQQALDIPNIYQNPGIDYNEQPPEYSQMGRNPMEFVNNIMRGYNPSEGYKYKESLLKSKMGNDAAMGGYRGSKYDQQEQARHVSGILGEDMQQWLSNILGVQGQGLAGEER